jgi:hypothetical protein
MHLDVTDAVSLNTSFGKDTFDQSLLSPNMRSCDRITLRGVVCCHGQNASLNRITILDGIVKAFEDCRDYCLSTAVSIGRLVEGLAVACPREEVSAIQSGMHVGICQDVGASYDRGIYLTAPQGVAGQMDSGQA